MSETTGPQIQGYGYTSDNDEALKTKSGGRFGLNAGTAVLAKFAYNPNTAKEGQEIREAIEITIKVGDRDYPMWISPVTRVYIKNQEYTEFTTPETIAAVNAEMKQQQAVITHIVKSQGVTDAQLQAALSSSPITSFADYANRLCSVLPAAFETRALDVFLEYQWDFGKKADGTLNDKTYAQLPKNMKGGYFIVPAQPGVWVEFLAPDGALSYKNANGVTHPIEKDAAFMEGKKGTQQVVGQAVKPVGTAAITPIAPGAAASSTWDNV
jgi:hypothetical protein